MFTEKSIIRKAKKSGVTIVYPEAGFSDRIIEGARKVHKSKIAKVLLIGDESALVVRYKNALEGLTIINPKTSDLTPQLSQRLYELRKEKGLTLQQAEELIIDPFYFSTMLVNEGYADGMVGGAEVSTARNLKPALQIIKGKEKDRSVCSGFLMLGKNPVTKGKPFILGDCGLLEQPTAEQLVVIAEECAYFLKQVVEQQPRIAFLSYSTNGSAKSEQVDKVIDATERFKALHNNVFCEGEVQMDSAVIPKVASIKFPESKLTEQSANVLVFPNLEAGNICYKAIQYFGGLKAIGPFTMGLRKPVNDLSRGCTVNDIVLLSAITALQCKNIKEKKI